VLCSQPGQPQQGLARGVREPFTWSDLAFEHHADQPFDSERRQRLTHQPALAEHRDPGTQLLHLFKLVRHEEDRLALRGEPAQRVEELLPLAGADTGGRLIQDEHPRPQPKKAEQFQLLPLAYRQRSDFGLEVDGES